MRYGTVPIVRETGGLKDTVQPYEAWRDAGTGFTFANYSSADMLHVIREAVYLYKDYPDAFARLSRPGHGTGFQLEPQRRGLPADLRRCHWPFLGKVCPGSACRGGCRPH